MLWNSCCKSLKKRKEKKTKVPPTAFVVLHNKGHQWRVTRGVCLWVERVWRLHNGALKGQSPAQSLPGPRALSHTDALSQIAPLIAEPVWFPLTWSKRHRRPPRDAQTRRRRRRGTGAATEETGSTAGEAVQQEEQPANGQDKHSRVKGGVLFGLTGYNYCTFTKKD